MPIKFLCFRGGGGSWFFGRGGGWKCHFIFMGVGIFPNHYKHRAIWKVSLLGLSVCAWAARNFLLDHARSDGSDRLVHCICIVPSMASSFFWMTRSSQMTRACLKSAMVVKSWWSRASRWSAYHCSLAIPIGLYRPQIRASGPITSKMLLWGNLKTTPLKINFDENFWHHFHPRGSQPWLLYIACYRITMHN